MSKEREEIEKIIKDKCGFFAEMEVDVEGLADYILQREKEAEKKAFEEGMNEREEIIKEIYINQCGQSTECESIYWLDKNIDIDKLAGLIIKEKEKARKEVAREILETFPCKCSETNEAIDICNNIINE